MRVDLLQQARLACGVLATATALLGCISDDAAAAGKTASAPTPSEPIAADRCAFGAFVQEDDPAGLNVRAAPSSTGRLLGTLPPSLATTDNPDFKVRIELEVLGQKDGWFHVEHARDNEQLTGKPARKVMAGDGWVSGRKLTVKSQATQGHAAPDAHSPTVLSLGDADGFDGDAIVSASHLVACRGGWALIEVDTARLPADVRAQLKAAPGAPASSTAANPRAWVDRLCAVQETTCEGQGAK